MGVGGKGRGAALFRGGGSVGVDGVVASPETGNGEGISTVGGIF